MEQGGASADDREDFLDDLRLTAVARLLVPEPLTRGALAVRGVVPVPGELAALRVALWNGKEPDSTVAFDIPLIDPRGDHIRHNVFVASLRDSARRPIGEFGPPGSDPVHGIPVLDAGAAVAAFN